MIRRMSLASCVLAVAVLFARAQDQVDLKDVLRKAIAAHGGEKALLKFQAGKSKYKGTMQIAGQNADVSAENAFQKPDKLHTSMKIDIGGNLVDVVTVFDGKKFWVSTNGMTKEIEDEKAINQMRETLQSEGGGLVEFLKAPFELSAIGEAKVKDRDTIGIRVSKKGQRDVNYYFDKKTHLLAKTEMRTADPMGQESTQEKIVLEYQEKAGVKVGKRVEILKDGMPFMNLEVTDFQLFEKLDDSHFAMP